MGRFSIWSAKKSVTQPLNDENDDGPANEGAIRGEHYSMVHKGTVPVKVGRKTTEMHQVEVSTRSSDAACKHKAKQHRVTIVGGGAGADDDQEQVGKIRTTSDDANKKKRRSVQANKNIDFGAARPMLTRSQTKDVDSISADVTSSISVGGSDRSHVKRGTVTESQFRGGSLTSAESRGSSSGLETYQSGNHTTGAFLMFGDILGMITELLQIHEVAVCLRVLETLRHFGGMPVGIPKDDFCSIMSSLVSSQGPAQASGGWQVVTRCCHQTWQRSSITPDQGNSTSRRASTKRKSVGAHLQHGTAVDSLASQQRGSVQSAASIGGSNGLSQSLFNTEVSRSNRSIIADQKASADVPHKAVEVHEAKGNEETKVVEDTNDSGPWGSASSSCHQDVLVRHKTCQEVPDILDHVKDPEQESTPAQSTYSSPRLPDNRDEHKEKAQESETAEPGIEASPPAMSAKEDEEDDAASIISGDKKETPVESESKKDDEAIEDHSDDEAEEDQDAEELSQMSTDDEFDIGLEDLKADISTPMPNKGFTMKFKSNKKRLTEEEDAAVLAIPSGPWIIHPNANWRMTWDILSLLLIVQESITVPLDLGFDMPAPDWWFWVTTIFFGIDIVLTGITGFFLDGVLIMKQQLILWHYFRTFLIIDVCSTCPWEVFFSGEADKAETSLLRFTKIGKLMRVMRLLRLVKLRALFQRLEDIFESYTLMIVFSLSKTLVAFGLFCHWSACLWGFLGDPRKVGHHSASLPPHDMLRDCDSGGACEPGIEGSPWRRRYAVDTLPSEIQYLAALHFSTGLITGSEIDLSPAYTGEKVYVVVMMIVSLLMCSFVVSQIVVIANKVSQHTTEFRDRMRTVKDFMVSRKVPIMLQVKVKRYLEYQFKARNANHENLDFIDNLSPWLRLELTEHLNKDVIGRHPFFQGMSSRVLKRICGAAITVLYAPGDLVVQKGQRASCMCFIVRGKLRVLKAQEDEETAGSEPGQNLLKSVLLTPPCWIGDMSLFKDMVRSKTVISVTHSELLTVMKGTLMELMAEFPKVAEYYFAYQKRVLEGDLIGTGMRCPHCMKPGHHVADCPELAQELGRLAPQSNQHHNDEGVLAKMKAFLPGLKERASCHIMVINRESQGVAGSMGLPKRESEIMRKKGATNQRRANVLPNEMQPGRESEKHEDEEHLATRSSTVSKGRSSHYDLD